MIIADDVESEPLANLIVNKIQGGISVAAVKAPSFGDNRKAILNDIAVLTGGTVISEEVGVSYEDSDESILGTAGKIEITKEDTILLHGNGDKYLLFNKDPLFRRELLRLSHKSKTLLTHILKKNFKRDCPNWLEESASSRSEEPRRWRSEKLRIESRTPSAPPRLPSRKVSSSEEAVLSCMPVEP